MNKLLSLASRCHIMAALCFQTDDMQSVLRGSSLFFPAQHPPRHCISDIIHRPSIYLSPSSSPQPAQTRTPDTHTTAQARQQSLSTPWPHRRHSSHWSTTSIEDGSRSRRARLNIYNSSICIINSFSACYRTERRARADCESENTVNQVPRFHSELCWRLLCRLWASGSRQR